MQVLSLIIASIVLILWITPITSLFLTQKKGVRKGVFWKSTLYSALFIWFIIWCIAGARTLNLPLESIAFYAMGFAIIGCLLALGFWILYLLLSIFNKQSILISLPVWVGFIVLRYGVVWVWIYNFQKPINVVNLEFTSPFVTETTRFVYFADTQFGSTTKTHLDRVVQTIHTQNPDFVAFGGDLIDTDYYQASDFEVFSTLEVPLYFITGNHEYYHDATRILQYLTQYPQIRVLENERLDLWNWVEIIGVDYSSSFDRIQYDSTIQSLQASPDKFTIFLNHEPKRVEETAKTGRYDLQLYWHTHNWQLYPWPRLIKAIYGIYGYWLNLIEWTTTSVYTTSGAGLFGPNIRIGTQNEIVTVILNPIE